MMRSQGVPARVVTGYQGGELNHISGEWEVKQLNAHAWAEIYLANKGWVRIDPTAAVAPSRIRQGSPFGVARNSDAIAFAERLESNSALYKSLSTTLRAMNAFWQNWVINYNRDKQASLWQKLGLSALKDILWIVFLVVLMPLTALLLWWLRQRAASRQGDAIGQTMQTFVRHLHKQGINKPGGLPWSDFIRQQDFGRLQPNAEHVIRCYYQLRYAETGELSALKQAIALFIKKSRQQ